MSGARNGLKDPDILLAGDCWASRGNLSGDQDPISSRLREEVLQPKR